MLGQIFQTFANCFRIPELRSRIIFTILVLLVARLVALTPIPGLDGTALNAHFESTSGQGGIVSFYSLFTGGALEKCSVGSLGIMPYISATIIIQLLSAVLPGLAKLSREEGGRAKMIAYGRYLTVLLCLGQGLMMAVGWRNPEEAFGYKGGSVVLIESLWIYLPQTVIILTAGTLMLMWLGEQISERGIGNGVSLLITVGILSRLPLAASTLWTGFFPPGEEEARYRWPHAILLLVLLAVVIAGVILVTQGQRKVPVQYAQRAVGRKVLAGGTSFMPLRVNYAGVMPVIFAQAILMFPGFMFDKLGNTADIAFFRELGRMLRPDSIFYLFAEALMIIFFSYFWVATQFNEIQIADDLKKHGGYIPGVRPGAATSDFLHRSMSRLTLAGAVFLATLAAIPTLMNLSPLKMDFNVATFFGGTSLLIAVGVLLDTMRQMESHLLLRQYDGFLKKGRVKGR